MEQELILTPTPQSKAALALFMPGKATEEYAKGLVKHASELKVSTDADFKVAAEVLNNITKAHSTLNQQRLALAREYDQARDENVNQPAKALIDPLAVAKGKVEALMQAHDRRVREERARMEVEKEQQRLKALQLEEEAAQRQALAAGAVEKATTEEAFEQGAQAFDRGLAVQGQALEMKISATAAPLPSLPKARGVKDKMVVDELTITDLSALPLTYHMADEAKIKKHILDGTLDSSTPGIRFTLKKKFSGIGR